MPTAVSTTARARAVLVLTSIAISIVAAEGITRLIGVQPRFGQQLLVRGVASRVVDGVPMWTERDPRYDAEDLRRAAADRDGFKIVALGDSILYGVSLVKADTYLEQARGVLAGRTKRSVDILNLAVPGYNTMQEAVAYKEIENQIQPNLVIVHYWEDDAHPYRVVGGYVVDIGNVSEEGGRLVVRAIPLPPRLNDLLLVHSRLYDMLNQVVVARNHINLPEDWTLVSRPLADLQERVQRAGGRLLVLASPELTDATPKPVEDLDQVQQFAASRGIEVVDITQWVAGVSSKTIAMDGCHFNAAGHRIIGEHLADYLLQHDLRE